MKTKIIPKKITLSKITLHKLHCIKKTSYKSKNNSSKKNSFCHKKLFCRVALYHSMIHGLQDHDLQTRAKISKLSITLLQGI